MKHDARSEGRGAGRKPKLEACKPKSRIKAGQFVTVFQDDGDVKLLPVSELLPAGLKVTRFSVLGRELVETFDPQYGYVHWRRLGHRVPPCESASRHHPGAHRPDVSQGPERRKHLDRDQQGGALHLVPLPVRRPRDAGGVNRTSRGRLARVGRRSLEMPISGRAGFRVGGHGGRCYRLARRA